MCLVIRDGLDEGLGQIGSVQRFLGAANGVGVGEFHAIERRWSSLAAWGVDF